MILNAGTLWRNVMIVSIVLSLVSALSLSLSLMGGEQVHVILSTVLTVIFVMCAVISYRTSKKYEELQEEDGTVTYFKLKRPGLEMKEEEEITPKGKMPGQ